VKHDIRCLGRPVDRALRQKTADFDEGGVRGAECAVSLCLAGIATFVAACVEIQPFSNKGIDKG
jgi:hypothetical protein